MEQGTILVPSTQSNVISNSLSHTLQILELSEIITPKANKKLWDNNASERTPGLPKIVSLCSSPVTDIPHPHFSESS